MEKIHILTDSSSDIPHDLVEAHGIEIVPIMLTHEGRSFREYYDITSEDYCRLLETSSEIPGTAMTTPTVFLESYNRAFERGCTHLLAVLINGGGSGTYQAACLAKSMFEEEQGEGKMTIEVIDSNCYTVGYGYPLMQACKKAQQGAEFEEVVAYIRDYLDRVRIYFSPFTLQYVKKSGRVSCTAAFVGELIGLRPVISAVGTTSVVEKVRGNAAILSSMEKMFAAQRSKKQENAPYMILVARDTPASQELAAACEKIAGYPPVGIYKIGAAITINTGPQIIGLTFLAD